jgi:hypothetical protein
VKEETLLEFTDSHMNTTLSRSDAKITLPKTLLPLISVMQFTSANLALDQPALLLMDLESGLPKNTEV